MAALRAILVISLVAAACAMQIPRARVNSLNKVSQPVDALSIATQGVVNDAIQKAVDTLRNLLKKVGNKIVEAEHKVVKNLDKVADNVVGKINDVILKLTGKDLDLLEKWDSLEDKVSDCSVDTKADLQSLIDNIKQDALTCTADQVRQAKQIVEQLDRIVELAQTIPKETSQSIKDCKAAGSDSEEDDSEEEDSEDADSSPASRKIHLPDLSVTECILHELSEAISSADEALELIVSLIKDIQQLVKRSTLDSVVACAEKSVTDKAGPIELSIAELAYCIIAPSEQ